MSDATSEKAMDMLIYVAGLLENSVVDGPGIRAVLFLQGCPHHCKGCHNPETWDMNGKSAEVLTIKELGDRILSIKGVNKLTLSGGDPIMQSSASVALISYLQDKRVANGKAPYHIMLYTGYTWEQLLTLPNTSVTQLLKQCDLVVDGPFIEAEKSLECRFRGSKNQRIIQSNESIMLGEIVYSEYN